jgi:hypothetical protein
LKESLEDMECADDVGLISHRFEHMLRKLDDHWEESKRVGIVISSSKTEDIRVNTTVNQVLRLKSRDIQRLSDLCYLGSVVSEDGGARTDVSVKIQKTRGSFSKLRKVWLSTSILKDRTIRVFNACVKSLLLYGCETWLVTSEILRKIQTSVNRYLRYILRIWWLRSVSNKDLWKATGQLDVNLEIRKKIWMDWSHTKKR